MGRPVHGWFRDQVVLLALIVGTASAQVAVVHAGVADAIDRAHLCNLLLGRVSTWADGSQVILVMSTDPASRQVIEDLTGRDLDRLVRGWKRIVFTGNGAMPIVAASAREALDTVSKRPGAIAIIGIVPEPDPQIRIALELGAAPAKEEKVRQAPPRAAE